jgi:peptide/nickel transport system permease protein
LYRFLIRRAFFAILTLISATLIVFLLSRAAGDPRLLYAKPGGYGISEETYAALGKKLGLDKPVPLQYLTWLGNTAKGDLGKTIVSEKPVYDLIKSRLGATLQLSIGAWIFASLFGVPIGILSAVNRGGFFDYLGRGFAMLGQAAPSFWLGIMGIYFFGSVLGWLPTFGRGDTTENFFQNWKHFVLPIVTLGAGAAAGYVRLTRSAMLDVLDSEYIRLARAKGCAPPTVIWKHAFRNALISPLTYSGLLLAGFLGGSVVIETVFAWPGIGRLATDAVFNNDFPVMTGTVLVFAIIFVSFSFVLDIIYALVDPRIRLGGQ